MDRGAIEKRVRTWLGLFIAGLVVSGLTAFPLVWEVQILDGIAGPGTSLGEAAPAVAGWIHHVRVGLTETQHRYPFIAYGTDWLAFAHLVIAIAFWGVWRQPVRNVWVVEFGIIACALVVPLAMVCGAVRGIPLFWRVIDCSFGVFGAIPLLIVRRLIRRLEGA